MKRITLLLLLTLLIQIHADSQNKFIDWITPIKGDISTNKSLINDFCYSSGLLLVSGVVDNGKIIPTIRTILYDESEKELWRVDYQLKEKKYNGPKVCATVIDDQKNCYILVSDSYNLLLLKYSSAGDLLYEKNLNNVSNGSHMIVDKNQNIYLSTQASDYNLLKIDKNGEFVWKKKINGVFINKIKLNSNNQLLIYDNSSLFALYNTDGEKLSIFYGHVRDDYYSYTIMDDGSVVKISNGQEQYTITKYGINDSLIFTKTFKDTIENSSDSKKYNFSHARIFNSNNNIRVFVTHYIIENNQCIGYRTKLFTLNVSGEIINEQMFESPEIGNGENNFLEYTSIDKSNCIVFAKSEYVDNRYINSNICIIKYNEKGDLVYKKALVPDTDYENITPRKIIVNSNNELLILCNEYFGFDYSSKKYKFSRGVIMRFSPSGEFISKILYDGEGKGENSIEFLGTDSNNNTIAVGKDGNSNLLITKIDTNGELVYTKKIEFETRRYGDVDCTIGKNDNILIVHKPYNDTFFNLTKLDRDANILKNERINSIPGLFKMHTDNELNSYFWYYNNDEQKFKSLKLDNEFNTVYDIVCSDNNFSSMQKVSAVADSCMFRYVTETNSVEKISFETGSVEWSVKNNSITNVEEIKLNLKNKCFYLIGKNRVPDTYNWYLSITKIDLQGNILWNKKFEDIKDLNYFIAKPDNTAIVFHKDGSIKSMKIDSDGNSKPIDSPIKNLYISGHYSNKTHTYLFCNERTVVFDSNENYLYCNLIENDSTIDYCTKYFNTVDKNHNIIGAANTYNIAVVYKHKMDMERVNLPPVAEVINDTIYKDDVYQYFSENLKISDPNNDLLSYEIVSSSMENPYLNNYPSYTSLSGKMHRGKYTTSVKATDPFGESITVNYIAYCGKNLNHTIKPIVNQIAHANNRFSYRLQVINPDNNSLDYSLVDGPSWMHMSGSSCEGYPSQEDIGKTFKVKVKIKDIVFEDEITTEFNVEVKNQNNLPEITSVCATKSIEVGEEFNYIVSVQDIDNDTLIYKIENCPSWLNWNSKTNTISGESSLKTIGTYTFSITVSDGYGGSDIEYIDLSVINSNNSAPETSSLIKQAHVFNDYTYLLNINDKDGDIVDVNIIEKPSWISYSEEGQMFYGFPNKEDYGVHVLNFKLTDKLITTEKYLLVNVSHPTNKKPVITTPPILEFTTGEEYVYNIDFYDPDYDKVSIVVLEKPDWLTFDNNYNTLSGKTDNYVSSFKIKIMVIDEFNSSDVQEFEVFNSTITSIEDVNDSQIKIYPNPVNNYLNIEYLPQTNEALSIYLLDINGRKIKTFIHNNRSDLSGIDKSYNVSYLKPGLYIISIVDGDKTANYKIIKQ